jgi:hypothetical protein
MVHGKWRVRVPVPESAPSTFGTGLKALGNPDAVRRLILAGSEVRHFHDPARPYLHPEDVAIALDIDRYDFAITVEFENGRAVARVERPVARGGDNYNFG